MAKRELSSTLKNLKFMQRAVKKEEPKVEEAPRVVVPDGNFVSANTQNRKCIVIMEGNPHPGAIKGRMSFQSFNPSIDKLNEPAESPCEPKVSSTNTSNGTSERENGSSSMATEKSNESRLESNSNEDHKRKHPDTVAEAQYPNKSPKSATGEVDVVSTPNNRNGSRKQKKRDRLDFNVLRPPKVQNGRD